LETALGFYASIGVLPEVENILLCSKFTTEEQVVSFIYRWRGIYKYRYTPMSGVIDTTSINLFVSIFVVVGISYLPYDVQSKMVKLIKGILSRGVPEFPLLLLSHENDKSQITVEYANKKVFVSQLSTERLCLLGANLGNSVKIWKSNGAGTGKTFSIKLEAYHSGMKYCHVPINNSFTPMEVLIKRLNNAKQSYSLTDGAPENGLLYHIDLSCSVDFKFVYVLFQLCFLGVLKDFNGESQCLFFSRQNTRFAIELAYGTQDSDLELSCQIYPMTVVSSGTHSFYVEANDLQAGMGEDFTSELYDGIIKNPERLRQTSEVTNAFLRLQYVVSALDSLKRNQGRFPFVFDHDYVDSYWVTFGSCKEDAFSLITEACNLQNRSNSVSLHCVWSFINVFFWQLQEMHHPESPLNGCCLVDENRHDISIEQETSIKGKMKGEIISFIARTAREFATRQLKQTENDMIGQVFSVESRGFSRGRFNTTWKRQPFDNDGQPCFQSMCRGYYLYYRSKGRCWVIDDVIYPSGTTYSISSDSTITSVWTTSSPMWETDKKLVCARRESIKGTCAHNNECVTISGCSKLPAGSYASATEDGVYLRYI